MARILLYTGKGGVGKTSIAAATALLCADRGLRTIVLDAAPTGETLRLLSLPDASRWWIERIAPIGRRVSRLGRPMLERILGIPIPRDEVFAAAERLLDRLADVHRLLSDPDQTSVRITLALDKLSVAEARRSFTYFHLFGYPSDQVIAIRVLPTARW